MSERHDISCAELISTFLIDYVDGKLPPDTLADFDHHLDVCVSCVAYLRSYRVTIAMTRQIDHAPRVDVDDVPEELVSAILDTVRGK